MIFFFYFYIVLLNDCLLEWINLCLLVILELKRKHGTWHNSTIFKHTTQHQHQYKTFVVCKHKHQAILFVAHKHPEKNTFYIYSQNPRSDHYTNSNIYIAIDKPVD